MQSLTQDDYRRIIDAETWAFIDKTNSFYPTDTYTKTIAEQREIYDTMCAAFALAYPAGVTASDTDAAGVPLRVYTNTVRKAGVTVIYAHGGGFVVGGLHSHDDICAEICAATGYDVIAVDYRLAPEFTLTDALMDMQRALEWARATFGGAFVLAGDSAGGYLCACLAHANRGMGDIRGQVLIYPGLGGQVAGSSLDRHAFAPMLTKAEVMAIGQTVKGGTDPALGGHRAPLKQDDFSGLPPTLAIAAQCDPLADDARLYAQKISAAGGTAFWFEDKGLVHAHLRARHMSKRARASFERVLRAIALISSGQSLSRDALGR